MFGLFVAYETRKIKVEAINDSKHIGKSKKKRHLVLVDWLTVVETIEKMLSFVQF